MINRLTSLLGVALMVLTASTAVALASDKATEKKVALVVGNAAYMHTAKLKNSRNDAEDVAGMLTKMGFEVVLGLDLTRPAFRELLSEFVTTLQGAKRAIFYYSGHALQVEGRNYLVPTDAALSGEMSLDFELVPLAMIQRALERQVTANVIFLDACRDNPLGRNLARNMGSRSTRIGRGLAPAESGIGTLISFSTQPGNVAADGKGRNSPFTAALLRHAQEKNSDVSTMLIKVRRDVMAATDNRQVPWEHSALRQRFFLNDTATATAQLEGASPAPKEGEGEFWALVEASEDPAFYREYLTIFPSGRHVDEARLRLAALTGLKPNTSQSETAAQPVTRSPAELATRAQKLLQRAGCYSGAIDGIWGRKSRYALRKALGPRIASSKLDPVVILRLEILVPGQCAADDKEKKAAPSAVPAPPKADEKPQVREARRPPESGPSRAQQRRARRERIERDRRRRARRKAKERARAKARAQAQANARRAPPKISRRRSNEVSAECRSWQRCAGASHPYRVRMDCPGRPRRCKAWFD